MTLGRFPEKPEGPHRAGRGARGGAGPTSQLRFGFAALGKRDPGHPLRGHPDPSRPK